ncbi:pyridoxal phosphate-dependent transferase [Fusarium redolens]|uniref:Pyridoxal phosphate-dependent transferase n=1 Tax=Fusarium redolens TaxID=48865 RepID=A0A9P9K8U7_FUSRE|nr:pyridoxal phosphate-dependent transferase [Fusarium redolens]KAH7244184.1 pyridoxal phosphate-dependent transferase [Fusarium redolens]
MGSIGQGSSQQLPVRGKTNTSVFGSAIKKEFLFDPEWRNLNHGSFGTYPQAVRTKFREYQDASEARPDPFIRYEYPKILDENRAAVAKLLNAPVDSVVFVSNATVGVNTVYRNTKWNEDGKDVIISFSTIYEACGKVADYLVDYYNEKVTHREIELTYPLDDEEIIKKFEDAVKKIESEGKRARICTFDVVSSRPGVVFPWQEMIKTCRRLNVLSMVDGAQGVGMVKLDLSAADPDFFVSNCHKWLHVPRGCAVFYVPQRNQALIETTLATSHGYVPKLVKRITPLPPSSKSPFVTNFEFVGTLDNSPYLCVKDAIKWRQEALGGEDAILEYIWDLNKKGSELVAEKLGTTYMENSTGTMRNCGMANIALPVWTVEGKEGEVVISAEETQTAFQWILNTLISDYKTFVALFLHGGRLWIRTSAQVYLEIEDYEWLGGVLKEICERVGIFPVKELLLSSPAKKQPLYQKTTIMGNSSSSSSNPSEEAKDKKTLYERFQAGKKSVPLSDEDILKYTGKTRDELSTWADTQPGVGKNQLAGSVTAGPISGLGGVAMADGLGGWGPSAHPNDKNRGMKFPPTRGNEAKDTTEVTEVVEDKK